MSLEIGKFGDKVKVSPQYYLIHGNIPVEKRIGCITILLDRQMADVHEVNERITRFGDSIIGRLGLPYPDRGVNIITLIVDCTVERLSAFTGQLGRLPGIQVKSLMAKELATVENPHHGEA